MSSDFVPSTTAKPHSCAKLSIPHTCLTQARFQVEVANAVVSNWTTAASSFIGRKERDFCSLPSRLCFACLTSGAHLPKSAAELAHERETVESSFTEHKCSDHIHISEC